MWRKRRAAWRLAAALLVFALVPACSGRKGGKVEGPGGARIVKPGQRALSEAYANRSPEDGGTFTRSLPADVVTLNPVLASDRLSYLAYKWIFDPLIDMDENMKPVGVLAESWETSPDGMVTTFHLRKDAVWQDGKPFTAEDVLFTYRAAMDPEVDAVNKRASFEEVKGLEKVDDHTVRVLWKEPYAPGLASWVFYIVPKHVYGYAPGDGKAFNVNPHNDNPVGSGPYRFSEWKRGDRLVLTANESYFGGRPHVDRLVFKVIPKSQTQLAAFKTGELDLVSLSAEQWGKVTADPEMVSSAWFFEYYAKQFFYVGWNMDGSNPFFGDGRVRRAMALAMNRRGVVDKLLKGHAMVGAGPFFPMGWAANPSVKPLPYDPERAGALLKEAGWADSDGDGVLDKGGRAFSFECLVPAEAPQFTRFLEVFQQDLRRVGVEMSIRKLEWSVFLERTHGHHFQAYLSGWGLGDDPDPYPLFHSSQAKVLPSGMGAGQNDFSYKSQEADRLMEAEEETFDPEKRKELFWQLDELLAKDQPITVLFWAGNLVALRDNFQGVRLSPAGYGLFGWYPSQLEWWVPKKKGVG